MQRRAEATGVDSLNRVELMGIPVSILDRDELMRVMHERITQRRPGGYISITNTESMYHALRRPAHSSYIRGADFSLCDGVGVIVAGWFWRHRIRRYNGPILQLDCSEFGQSYGWRHFYFGGKEGVADTMATKLREKLPDLQVVGTFCPPFREPTPEEERALIDSINKAKPDVLWVGLGLLKQEAWIARMLPHLNVPWAIGVGAAFDYHSGNVPWAPRVLRSLGLEWLFRLVIQPRIRAKRYWWSLVFVIQASWAGLKRRFERGSERNETTSGAIR